MVTGGSDTSGELSTMYREVNHYVICVNLMLTLPVSYIQRKKH